MRLQELEREGEEQVVSIDRLNAALSKYCEEVKGLEILVNQLEADKTVSQEQHSQHVAQLEERLARQRESRSTAESAVAEREERIRQLEGTVEANQIRVCDLTAKVESIEKERWEAIESLEQKIAEQVEHHENEVGLLNVRVSELTTALEAAKSEAEKLLRSNIGLQEQLQQEMEARDNLLDRWAADQARSYSFMKETVNSERRKAKIRAANWEMKSDDLQSDGIPLPSEPITPVSMTRFVDVEVGRGKNRRRLDSGIGILTEEDIMNEGEDGADLPMGVNHLPSDPAEL
jgi:chromosome segregation ATPase